MAANPPPPPDDARAQEARARVQQARAQALREAQEQALRQAQAPGAQEPPAQPEPDPDRGFSSATRAKLAAFACAAVVFIAFTAYLVLDQLSVSDRLSSVAGASVPAAPAKPAPELRADPALPLNEVLKYASRDDWPRVDEILEFLRASSPPRPAGPASRAGRKAIDEGNYGAAVRVLGEAVAEDPFDAEALNLLAYALIRTDKAAEAHRHVTRSLNIEPLRGSAWANAAEIFAEEDNALASLAALKVAVHLSQDRAKTLAFLSGGERTLPGARFRAVVAEALPGLKKVPQPAARKPT